jgi:hypothetical protein
MAGVVRRGLVALALSILILCFASAASAAEAPGSDEVGGMVRTEAQVRAMYDQWMARHGKAASNALGEHDRRFRAFWDNLRFVDAHNARAGARGYRLGMNRFADLTNAEFRAAYLSAGARNATAAAATGERYRYDGVEALPEFVDWRQQGAVAPVKNQGQCGKDRTTLVALLSSTSSFFPVDLCIAIA